MKDKRNNDKSCPFCGGPAVIGGSDNKFYVECLCCPCTLDKHQEDMGAWGNYSTEKEAVNAWNKRAIHINDIWKDKTIEWICKNVDEMVVPADEGDGDALIYNLVHLVHGDGKQYNYEREQVDELKLLLGDSYI